MGLKRTSEVAGLLSVLWLTLAWVLPVGGAEDARVVALWFHVSEREGQAVASDAFLAEQLVHVNQVYVFLGVRFVEGGRSPLDARHARLVTRSDRDALARHV